MHKSHRVHHSDTCRILLTLFSLTPTIVTASTVNVNHSSHHSYLDDDSDWIQDHGDYYHYDDSDDNDEYEKHEYSHHLKTDWEKFKLSFRYKHHQKYLFDDDSEHSFFFRKHHRKNFKHWIANNKYCNTPAVVPVPASIWLFGSALILLIGICRRDTANT